MIFDINTTSVCNLGCRYCSEGKNPNVPDKSRILNSKTKVKISDLDLLVNQVRSENPSEDIVFAFWGGEPFINFEFCKEVMEHFEKDARISFLFYSNGWYIEKYIDDLKDLDLKLGTKPSDGRRRLFIQISYDGQKVNDIERTTKSGASTAAKVKAAFELLVKEGFETKIKSTITPPTFKYMYDSFVEIINIPGSDSYFPTPDAFSDYDFAYDGTYMNDLARSLAKIARYIYEHKLNPEKFAWFRKSKALCSAGINYYSIDLDGEVSPCHSTMYETFSDHRIGNLKDIDLTKKLKEATERYRSYLEPLRSRCEGCTTLYCMKCPAGCYNLKSNIESLDPNLTGEERYKARWTGLNKNMCKVFMLNDVIHKSLLRALRS